MLTQGKATLFKKLPGNKVRCTACCHYCTIPEGRTGICGIRKNISGNLHLLVYGKPSAAHLDPVEKKPLFHFLPGSAIFSIGTVGCNFSCSFCQNWDISQASKKGEVVEKPETNLPPEKIVEYCADNNIPSIAFTYNEPSVFFEYAFDTMKLAKKENIKTVFVSNGYGSPEALEKMHRHLDAINIDLKSFNPIFYQKNCKARLEPVLENIRKMKEKGIWVEVTTLVIPKENDSSPELKQIAEFIFSVDESIPWHVTAFHPDYQMTHRPATPPMKLREAWEIGRKAGLKFIYTGNLLDTERQNTICPQCNKMLIRRDWHSSEIRGMKDGRCISCKTEIPGIWKR